MVVEVGMMVEDVVVVVEKEEELKEILGEDGG